MSAPSASESPRAIRSIMVGGPCILGHHRSLNGVHMLTIKVRRILMKLLGPTICGYEIE
jgi:hypothetical protein